MPLYSDPGYYYGGSSSYSPYYTSNPYASYAGYSRALAGTYIVPTSRTSHITSSSSRYKPKLTPISELPLASRGLTSLTRIQSPKISYHSVTPKYIPSRPININAADIDVSASRYPKHEHYFPPIVATNSTPKDTSSDLNNNSSSVKPSDNSDFMPRIDGTDPPQNRNTIKRNRAVVRLSIMRSKSKEKIQSNSSKRKDAPAITSYVPVQDTTNSEKPQKSSWRDNFGEDLIPKAKDFTRKTPGELLMERHLIRDKQKEANALKFQDLSKVPLESDALLNVNTIRRLSLSKCPSFHEICADISSDKIDDDLNAGELRRRASLIQEQEIEILNELQKSGSGLIQYILERNESQDDCRKSTKRKSKRGKKIRHKITATVDIDDVSPPPVTPILEELSPTKPSPPKLVFSVDAVEEDHTINTVVTLPKIKRAKPNAEGAEKVEELKTNQKVIVESEQTEKIPKLIVKSDSVVNVTLEINRKVAPKTTGAETEIVPKKSHENQIGETATKTFDKSLSPEERPIEEHVGKKLSPEKKAAEPTKHLSPQKKIVEIETRRLSPEKKTTLNKETKKSTLEVKSGIEAERSKSLPPEVSQNVETIASRKSLDDTKEFKKIESSKIFETNKTEIGKIGDQVQFVKPSDQPKSVSKMKELFANDQKTSSKIAEEKAKNKALSPEKKTEIGKIGEPKSDQPKSVSKMMELFVSDQSVNISVKDSKRDEKKEMLAVKEADKIESPKGKELSPEKKSLAKIFEERAAKKAVPTKGGADLPVAKPKPIIKLQRSDSGEDFWGQIGSRETLYMDKRKQKVVENQWEKRENLLEDRDLQNANDAKSIQTIKDKLSTQKTEALKEAADLSSTKKDVRRSVSNASALTKPETKKLVLTSKSTAATAEKTTETKEKLSIDQSAVKPSTKSNNIDVKATCDKKISPDSGPLKIEQNNQTTTTKTTSTTQKENIIIESPIQSAPGRSTSAETKSSPPIPSTLPQNATATAASTTTDRSAPKINVGLAAKSPETKIKQTSSGQNDHTPTEDKYKDLTNLSKETKTTTAAAQPTTSLATTPKPSTAIIPAKKGDQLKCSALIESGRVAAAAAKKDTGPKAQPAGTPPPQSPQLSTIQTNGGQHDNDKISTIAATGSRKENKKTQQSGSKNSPRQRSNEQRPAATPTILQSRDVDAADKTDRRNENVATKIGTDAAGVVVVAGVTNALSKPIDTAPEPTTTKSTEDDKSRSDSNLNSNSNSKSKFATVSNLSRCLIDVDADLSDYYPSDPFSSSDEDVNTSECSSCNGDSNYYSRSMKKKAKHTHHNQQKKKDKEAKKFDPNKKIKLDHTKKCYVKEEAPPYPLIATPRPLWKREKFNLPKDSPSDSEETESDSECSSSDECSGDELTSTAKNVVAATPDTSDIRMSTCSNDSGFEGGTAPTSPKKMLGAHDVELPPSHKPVYKIYSNHDSDDLETSYTFAQFQRSGRITAPATIIPRFKKYSVDDFHFLAVLGKGSFGKVLLAELRNTDYCYAVKCLKKDVVLEDDDVECTLIERKVLALGTKHPYLCHLFCTFQTESHLFFVMEYLNGGDLMFHIQQSGRFPEPRARFYAAEIISGLKFLHKKGIIYRDLKLDNVLLDFDGHVRIADFGMCKLQIYLDKTADSFCGTPDYMAPEIIKGDKYNQNVDWWSFGVLLYEMLIGQSPFSGCDEDELFWSICNEIPWFPIFITKEGISILKGLLEKDSNIRLGSQYSPAGDICDHPFFREIDWNRLDRRAIDPPFKPQVKHPLDTKYFDKTFTRERVRLTPIDKEILQSMDQVQFEGFSYTNPNATLN